MNYPRALLAAFGVVVVVALAVAASTSGTAFGAYNPAWDGASDLRERAEATGAELTIVRNTEAYGERAPSATVAVVLSPDEPYGSADAERLRAFVRDGGTLVVAEDYGPHANALLADVGAIARVDGRPLRDERVQYRSPAMPIASPVSNHSLVAGVDELTLNHGTAVRPGNASILVASSEYAYLDTNDNEALDDDESMTTQPVATRELVGDGHVIVLGDPSAVINVMLDRPGNDRFVRNLFEGTDRVVLDYSHAADIPPLALAVLVLRESAALQIVVAGLGLVAIGLWTRGAGRRVRRRRDDRDLPGAASEAELAAHVRRRHPEWDEERIRRVIRGVIMRREESDDDE